VTGPSGVNLQNTEVHGNLTITGVTATGAAGATPESSHRAIHLRYQSMGRLFKGRDAFLDELRASLLRTHPSGAAIRAHAITGMGGIGKTRAAVEYAWRHHGDYSALLLLDADAGDKLDDGLAALAGVLRLPEAGQPDRKQQIQAALGWLRDHPGWLLILDNVDTVAALNAVVATLGKLTGGHVVLTTRLSKGQLRGMEALDLGVLDLPDAASYLLEDTNGLRVEAADDEAQALSLAQDMDGLALALDLAAATIRERRCTFAAYATLWRDARQKVKGWNNPALTHYPHAVSQTWATSVALVSPEARILLERLAFLAPDPVPESLLDVPVPGTDPLDAPEALLDLAAYSLVTRDPTAAHFEVHRVIQDATRRGLDPATARQRLTEALGWIDAAFTGDPQDVRTWPTLDPLAPHAEAVAQAADEATIAAPTARLFGELAILFHTKAQYQRAEPFSRRALAIDETSLGPDHPTVATRLNNLAELLRGTNRLTEAEPMYRRALPIDEASFGPDHPDVARDLNNLALLLRATNRLTEAEPLFRRALAIDEASFGPDHPTVATDLNNLAELLRATNRLTEAEPLFRRALAIDEASLGPDHPTVATRLNNLAELLRDTNRLMEAEPLYRRALAVDEASLGPDHPNVARDLNNLAALLRATNRLTEAEPLFRRALAITEASLGPGHPNVATGLNNLATLLHATDRLTEAGPLLRRALAIDEASLGPDHPDVARDLNNLGALLCATNRLTEAEPLMRRMVTIFLAFQRDTGHVHPHRDTVINNYAILLSELGHDEAAIRAALDSARREAGLA
jgi:tetratricopeptide (TPR) repeat protein